LDVVENEFRRDAVRGQGKGVVQEDAIDHKVSCPRSNGKPDWCARAIVDLNPIDQNIRSARLKTTASPSYRLRIDRRVADQIHRPGDHRQDRAERDRSPYRKIDDLVTRIGIGKLDRFTERKPCASRTCHGGTSIILIRSSRDGVFIAGTSADACAATARVTAGTCTSAAWITSSSRTPTAHFATCSRSTAARIATAALSASPCVASRGRLGTASSRRASPG